MGASVRRPRRAVKAAAGGGAALPGAAALGAAAELGLSVSTARNHFELACALGVLSSRMERVGCTRRNVYKVVAGRG